MEINFHNKVKWNIPLISQYEAYGYSPMLCCPECSCKCSYHWIEASKTDIVGYCEVNGELQVCCECHICGEKYRYHFSKNYTDDYDFDVERWQDDLALHLYVNREAYKKFEIKVEKGGNYGNN